MTWRRGFSLLETLISIAIIMILVGMTLPVLSRARQKALQVAEKEGLRQLTISALAGWGKSNDGSREACREAFRQEIRAGKNSMVITEMLYVVTDVAEFRAYFHTLIDSAASGPLEFDDYGNLLAADEEGQVYALPPMRIDGSIGTVPVAWTFLSSNMAHNSSGTIGTEVVYSDGHVQYIRYHDGFPALPAVASLSNKFMTQQGL